jgi:tetratricopeptide (TPR) repeat protein
MGGPSRSFANRGGVGGFGAARGIGAGQSFAARHAAGLGATNSLGGSLRHAVGRPVTGGRMSAASGGSFLGRHGMQSAAFRSGAGLGTLNRTANLNRSTSSFLGRHGATGNWNRGGWNNNNWNNNNWHRWHGGFAHHRGFGGFGFPFFGFSPYWYGFGLGWRWPFLAYSLFGYPWYGGYGYPYGYGGYYGYPYSYGSYYGYPSYGYGGYGSPYASTYNYYNYYPSSSYLAADTYGAQAPLDQSTANQDFAAQGETAFKSGDYAGAARAWRHAIVDDPTNATLLLMMAQALFATGQYNEAAGAVQAALSQMPEDQWGVVVSNYPELYGNIGDYTRQLRQLEDAAKKNPKDPALLFLLGYHYGYLGYPSQAERKLKQATELAPQDPIAKRLHELMVAKLPSPPPAAEPAGGANPPPAANGAAPAPAQGPTLNAPRGS